MRSGRPGPVLVDYRSTFRLRKSSLILTCTNRCGLQTCCQPYADRKSCRNVNQAERPVIVAGGGVINADAAACYNSLLN